LAIRPFSVSPQAVAELNLTVPSVTANTTVEQAYDPASIAGLKPFLSTQTVLVNVREALTIGGVSSNAFPTGLGVANAYVNSADNKVYIRFSNSTAGTLGNLVCTFKLLGL
jgi:hypothetical protein